VGELRQMVGSEPHEAKFLGKRGRKGLPPIRCVAAPYYLSIREH